MKKLSPEESKELLNILKNRFEKNMNRHKEIKWVNVEEKLKQIEEKLWSLSGMERTGGEPDVVGSYKGQYIFCDCSKESPKGRRSLCYDRKALDSRKSFKPKNSVIDMAHKMDIELLTEEDYRQLQELGEFDIKTSSWIETSSNIRELGGAIFGDYRYGRVFIYHNGADSYYASRGFRGILKV